jgi:hypothetical protein
MSATSRIISSNWSRLVCCFAETSTVTVCAAPFFRLQSELREFTLHALWIRSWHVDLVDRHDDRHAGRLRVVDGFLRLRHDAVIGRHHEDDDVGDLGAAGTHHREGRVTWCVEEHDATFVDVDRIRTDVLRDAAGFALGDLGLADRVEQRRLTVVNVTHDGDDRCAFDHVFRIGRRRFCTSTTSSSNDRMSTSAPKSRAMSCAVSASSVELMVIIMRRSINFFMTSFALTSSLSARSFTVMPSASVISLVMGGNASGIC